MEYGGSAQGRGPALGNNPDRQPINTGLITEFRRVSQMVQNNSAAEKSRKTSRLTKGLNPDVPRPVNQNPGRFVLIQLLQKIKNKHRTGKQIKKHHRFQRWISTGFPWRNYAIDLGLTLNPVKQTFILGLTTDQAMKRNA